MEDVFIVDAVRTPFGKRNGSFRDTHPQDLAAEPLGALEERNGFSGSDDIEDVIYGCVAPVGEQGLNIGRLAPMIAGWGDSVPGVQLNRMCGSGQQAVNFAAGQIAAGHHDVVVAGGVEHMTRVPLGSDTPSETNSYADRVGVSETYFEHFEELTSQGEGAERMAEQWGFDRREMDEIAADSQRRWGEAAAVGHYDEQVVPVETTLDGDSVTVEEDEHPRPGSTPTTWLSTIRAIGSQPCSATADSPATSVAAAPSTIPEALPAWRTPSPASRNASGRFDSFSASVPGRGCSSSATVTESPSSVVSTGTTCSS